MSIATRQYVPEGETTLMQMKVSVSMKPQALEDHPFNTGEHEHRDEAVDTGGPRSQSR